MTAAGTFTPDSDIDRIFGPVVRSQTYRHLAYDFLGLPLGVLYFTTMIVGLSAGFATSILVIGFVILGVTLALARLFGRMEREMAKALLGTTFEPRPPFVQGWRALLRDRYAWRTVIYLILRLPVGIMGFVAAILMIAAIPAMAAPLAYTFLPYFVDGLLVRNWDDALLVSLFGCVFFLVAAHLVNAAAALSRRLAAALL